MGKAAPAERQRAASLLAARRARAVEAHPVVTEIEGCATLQSVQDALGDAVRHEDVRWSHKEARPAPPPWLLPPMA